MKIFKEKRKHIRFPVMKDMVKPILMQLDKGTERLPAFILDLSAGGIGIITFKELKPKMKITLQLDLPGLHIKNIQAEVIWTTRRSETYRSGIKFLNLSEKYTKMINDLARDYLECEMRIAIGVGEICVKSCRYRKLCEKQQKR